jgi:RNA polymerase sigma-70 factor (family 1)
MATLSTLSDQELAFLLQEGDQGAYNEIYERFKGVLHLHAYKKLGDFEEAKDVIQELFVILWDKRETIPSTTNFSGYLYQMLRNKIFDIISHKAVESRYIASIKNFFDVGHATTDYRVRERDLTARIESEINNLPPKMREVFILSRKNQLSHKEIAQELSISESTVKNQIKSALKILRVRLGILFYIAFLFYK